MAVSAVTSKVKRSFLMVDITPDDDCLGVAPMLQRLGWTNILRKLLPVIDPKDGAGRFRDDAHPKLPILDGFVLPSGRIRKAKSKTDGWTDEISTVPYDTVEANMEFMRRFMWKPGVLGDLGAKKGQLLDATNSVVSGTPEYPDLVFLSSHGYPDGKFQQHYKRDADPAHDHNYHVVFEVPTLDSSFNADHGWESDGTLKWVIFSACNALRPELAYRWAQGMRRPKGPRGVLGFYSISPGPEGTVSYMRAFFANQKRPMIDAWATACGSDKPWSGLVFEGARSDTFDAWSAKDPDAAVDNQAGKILYFHREEAPTGIDVEELHPKKMLTSAFLWLKPDKTMSGVSERGGLKVGSTFLLYCAPPKGFGWPAGANSLEISLVNLRENWWTGNKNPPDLKKFGFRAGIDSTKTKIPEGKLTLKSKFTAGKSKDTVVVPKEFLGKWVGIGVIIPPEAYSFFYGDEAKLWFRSEVLDASGKRIGRGSSLEYGLMPIRAASERLDPNAE
jgi:hypothetical protein